jgi:hypothetical protein
LSLAGRLYQKRRSRHRSGRRCRRTHHTCAPKGWRHRDRLWRVDANPLGAFNEQLLLREPGRNRRSPCAQWRVRVSVIPRAWGSLTVSVWCVGGAILSSRGARK